MNDELNPKLREFEAKLRKLRPLDVSPPFCRPPRRRNVYVLAAASTVAAVVLAVVCLVPPPKEPVSLPSPPQIEPAVAVVPAKGLTIRQQLTQLLGEMNIATPIAEKRPEYPVVEIAVCNAPPPKIVESSVGRLPLRREEQMLMMLAAMP